MKIFFLALALFTTVECSNKYFPTITKKAQSTSPNILHLINFNPESQSKPIALRSSDCPSFPCVVHMGQEMSFQADFTPAKSHNGMTVNVSYEKNNVKRTTSTFQIPVYIEAGQEYTLSMAFKSKRFQPGPTIMYIDGLGTDDGLYEFGGSGPLLLKDGNYP